MKKKKNYNSTDFEWFEDRGSRITDSFITISEKGTFLLSSGFVLEAEIEPKTFVKFGYNEAQDLIAFDFTTDAKVKGGYTVVLRGEKSKSGSITSRAFFKKNNLDPEKIAGRYTPELIKVPRAGEFWTIDLNERLK